MAIPQRIFLDTSVVNFITKYGEAIFDGGEICDDTDERTYYDICSLSQLFHWSYHSNPVEMVISSTTFAEVNATKDTELRERLLRYCWDLDRNFRYLIQDDFKEPGIEVEYYEEYLIEKGLEHLIDKNDRKLIIESLFFKCDVFCTRDWKTILKHRVKLKKKLPLL